MKNRVYQIASHFMLKQGAQSIAPYGNGHINDTFCICVDTDDDKPIRYILQRVNRNVFPKPENVMENMAKVTAYLRAFPKGEDTVQMGRVLTRVHGTGLGGQLLKEGIAQIRRKMNPKQIYLEAQCYAAGFYAREGFEICSDEFLEDGIPHVQMMLKL